MRKVRIEDAGLLFEWRNDLEVRENSFTQREIPYIEHVNWLKNVLLNPKIFNFILMNLNETVGQIRIELEEKMGLINYSISKKYRRQGYGKTILLLAEEYLKKDIQIDIVLLGLVKKSNIASQKAFLSSGYICVEQAQCFRYTKLLKSMEKK